MTCNFKRWTAVCERVLNVLEYIYIKVQKVKKLMAKCYNAGY